MTGMTGVKGRKARKGTKGIGKGAAGRPAVWWSGVTRAPGRARVSLRRAREHPGPERETALLVGKSAAAGVLSWALAAHVIVSPQPTYAPFTALLVVQSTAYRSLLQSARYVVAVVLGVLAAGAAGPLLGENVAAFAAMLLTTLVIGRWRRLGTQGVQVSVAGVFAYNALSGTHVSMLWQIIEMALLGAAIGVGVTLLILPPLRYRAAAVCIDALSHAIQQLLHDIAEGVDGGMPERDTAADWLRRARWLDTSVANARRAVESSAESILYNPRRLLRPRTHPTGFTGYSTLVEALARAAEQIRSLCYGLLHVCDDRTGPCPNDQFLHPYAALLAATSHAATEIGCLDDEGEGEDEDEDEDEGEGEGEGEGNSPLARTLEDARARHRDLTAAVEGTSAWPTHGVLLTDAARLLEEFARAHAQGAAQPR